MPTSKRADLSKVLPAVRCTARKRNGEPCKAMAARGANVCRVHGGSAPQVKAAAQRRLQNAADVLVERLLGFALDGQAPDAFALQAVRDALDRAGMNPKTGVEIEVKPYQAIFEQMESGGSRAEHRRSMGIEDESDPSAITTGSHDEPIDADDALDVEVIDAEPMTPDDREHGTAFDSAPEFNPFAPAHPPDARTIQQFEVSPRASPDVSTAVPEALPSLWPKLRARKLSAQRFRDKALLCLSQHGTIGLAGTGERVDCPPRGAAVFPAGITIGIDGASIPPPPPSRACSAAMPTVPSGTVIPKGDGSAWRRTSGDVSSFPTASTYR